MLNLCFSQSEPEFALGSRDEHLESLIVPLLAMIVGLVPGILLMVSMSITNERY